MSSANVATLPGPAGELVVRAEGRPLRICYVSSDYPATTGAGIGGMGAHTYTLAHAVAALGHDVSVLTEADAGPDRFADGLVTVHAIPRGARRLWKLGRWVPVPWLRRSFDVWKALLRLQRGRPFDLVSFADGYGEGFRYSYSPLSPYAVRLMGPASIVQAWDGRPVPPTRARVEEWIERTPVARASLLMTATQWFANFVARRWSLDARRIKIVRNPVDVDRFRPSASHPEGQRVLFVGHVQHLKGLATLAAAAPLVAAEHPTVEFLIVGNDTRSGPGAMSMRRSLKQTLSANGALERVRFVDPLSQPELPSLYQGSALLVLPSLHEVYGNVVLEGMACGRPCVVTSAVGASELVAEARCGTVVPPERPEALAAAISAILAMPDAQRAEMGARARRTVEQSCAKPVIASQTVEVYREALRDHALQPGGHG